jgi:hypothetical protein
VRHAPHKLSCYQVIQKNQKKNKNQIENDTFPVPLADKEKSAKGKRESHKGVIVHVIPALSRFSKKGNTRKSDENSEGKKIVLPSLPAPSQSKKLRQISKSLVAVTRNRSDHLKEFSTTELIKKKQQVWPDHNIPVGK